MCSSPKGGSTKPLLSSNVDSTSGDMSSDEYSEMVHRANESFERRQEELIEYRKSHKIRLSAIHKKSVKLSLFEKMKAFFSQNSSTQQLESK
ncbi:MAG: hypothetical protein DIZ80_08395 [endosymbiont of Galathealinum brachiosum]|uniref:Uncharacterized protein n=1 Tax=endosymbiont of Galathealinum brachiosum TaxID=2200906 RepID=A0A370DCK3_9GAMM|nr:MAG: hypothetical protein DIZ80_08395 [endosymbiont of Galathealinum brachiosum]